MILSSIVFYLNPEHQFKPNAALLNVILGQMLPSLRGSLQQTRHFGDFIDTSETNDLQPPEHQTKSNKLNNALQLFGLKSSYIFHSCFLVFGDIIRTFQYLEMTFSLFWYLNVILSYSWYLKMTYSLFDIWR